MLGEANLVLSLIRWAYGRVEERGLPQQSFFYDTYY